MSELIRTRGQFRHLRGPELIPGSVDLISASTDLILDRQRIA
jgi:hypothetical protein